MLKLFKNFPQNYQSKIHPLMVVLPLFFYGLYRRFLFRAKHDLWSDELYQIQICDRPFFEFLRLLPKYDFCRYLNGDYILTYPFFKFFGMNKWALSVPHMFATVLGFYFLYLICRRNFTTIWGYLITFSVFAFNLTLIRHALEIRPYGFLPGLSLAVYYFIDLVTDRNIRFSKFRLWGVGALFVFAIWFHPYGILMMFFFTVFWVLARSENIKKFFEVIKHILPLYSMVLVIAMPLWLYSFFGDPVDIGTGRDVFQFIPNPLVSPFGFFKGVFCNLIGYKMFYPLFLALPIAFLMPTRDQRNQIGFFLTIIIIPTLLIMIMVMHNHYWFIQRQLIWIIPLFIFLLGWCCESSICFMQSKIGRKAD